MGSVTVGGHTLTWTERTPGDETIVFINGWTNNQAFWGPIITFLNLKKTRQVTLDLLGHFPATAPDGWYKATTAELAEVSIAAIREIGGGKPVILVGHSAGGHTALVIAHRAPELVKGVVPIAPAMWGTPGGLLGVLYQFTKRGWYGAAELMLGATRLSEQSMRLGIATSFASMSAVQRNRFLIEACRQGFESYKGLSARNAGIMLNYLAEMDARLWASEIEVPVLAIGGAVDPLIPMEKVRWLGMHLKHCEVQMYSKIGHSPHFESPFEFRRDFEGFVKKLG